MMEIPQPAMAMNSYDVPGADYQMTNTWTVGKDETPAGMLGWAAYVLKGFKKEKPGQTTTLVLNCHGYSIKRAGQTVLGYGLAMGTGIGRADVVQFKALAPYCDQIYITACGPAYIDIPGGSGDGNLFISAIAKAAQAYVTASTTFQTGALWLPFGYIDDFEGTVLTYGPEGGVVAVEYH